MSLEGPLEGERLSDAIQMLIAGDVIGRMCERSEGRFGIGGHRSDVWIVFHNQSLWGISDEGELTKAITQLAQDGGPWQQYYEQRAQDDHARFCASLKRILEKAPEETRALFFGKKP